MNDKSHIFKRNYKKYKMKRGELKRKQWKMHINFGRQTVSEKWRGNERTAATRQAILLTMDMCIGASGLQVGPAANAFPN